TACAITPGTVAAGVVTTTSSGANGRSRSEATAGTPSICRYLGLTRPTAPAKPAWRRLWTTVRPTDPGRGLAPTTATDFGAKTASSAWMLIRNVSYVSGLNDTAVRPWALPGGTGPGRSSPISRDNPLTRFGALILINAPLAPAADDACHP